MYNYCLIPPPLFCILAHNSQNNNNKTDFFSPSQKEAGALLENVLYFR